MCVCVGGCVETHRAQLVKNSPASARDVRAVGSILGSGRSSGGGHDNPFWDSILAWRIPWTEEPRRLQSMGLQRVRQDLVIKPPTASNCLLDFHLERKEDMGTFSQAFWRKCFPLTWLLSRDRGIGNDPSSSLSGILSSLLPSWISFQV